MLVHLPMQESLDNTPEANSASHRTASTLWVLGLYLDAKRLKGYLADAFAKLSPREGLRFARHWASLLKDFEAPATFQLLDALPESAEQGRGYDILRIEYGGHQVLLHAPTLARLPDAALQEMLLRVLALIYFYIRALGLAMLVTNDDDLSTVAGLMGSHVRRTMQRWRQPMGALKRWRQEAGVRLLLRCERPAGSRVLNFVVRLRPDCRAKQPAKAD